MSACYNTHFTYMHSLSVNLGQECGGDGNIEAVFNSSREAEEDRPHTKNIEV